MQKAPRTPAAKVRNRAGRGRVLTGSSLLLIALLAACKENLSPPNMNGTGADTTGPLLQLNPAHDTLVDSTGVLLVHVGATDKSGVVSMTFTILPTVVTPPTITGADTTLDAFFPVTLSSHKHGSFKFFATAFDILGHETVTDTVTVTVK